MIERFLFACAIVFGAVGLITDFQTFNGIDFVAVVCLMLAGIIALIKAKEKQS